MTTHTIILTSRLISPPFFEPDLGKVSGLFDGSQEVRADRRRLQAVLLLQVFLGALLLS